MKKLLNTVLVVTFLTGLAHAADPATQNPAKGQSDQQRVRQKKAHPEEKPAPKPANATGPSQHNDHKHAFKKPAKDINRPGPTPHFPEPDAVPAPVTR